MPCCLSLSKQTWAFPTMLISVLCIDTVPCEIKQGESKGLAQGPKQCKDQFLA